MADTTTRTPMVLNTTMTERVSRSTRLQTVVLRPRASKPGQVVLSLCRCVWIEGVLTHRWIVAAGVLLTVLLRRGQLSLLQ